MSLPFIQGAEPVSPPPPIELLHLLKSVPGPKGPVLWGALSPSQVAKVPVRFLSAH